MKWDQFALPRFFTGKTSHHEGGSVKKVAVADNEYLPGIREKFGTRNSYEHDDETPPGNEAVRGADRTTTKTGV